MLDVLLIVVVKCEPTFIGDDMAFTDRHRCF